MDGDFAAGGAHSDADVAGRKGRGVIHSVADDGNRIAFRFDAANELDLVLGEALALGFLATDFARHASGDGLAVAGDHGDSAHAAFLQFAQGLAGVRAGLILQTHPADAFAIAGHKDQAPAFGFVEVHGLLEILGYPTVLEPLGAADKHGAAIDLRLNAAAGGFGEVLGLN